MNILLDLFLTFAKIGLFTFGGGYAMISMIENNCVERKRWITHDEMMNVTVVAESTPGPIAINCATFTGYKKRRLVSCFISNPLPYRFPGKALFCKAFSSLETKATKKFKKNQNSYDNCYKEKSGF